jgi:signal recognition particle subunit SEC65
MTPEEIVEIARSLGLDTEEDKGLPRSTSETEEPMLVWNLDDVLVLFNGEDRDVHPISG